MLGKFAGMGLGKAIYEGENESKPAEYFTAEELSASGLDPRLAGKIPKPVQRTETSWDIATKEANKHYRSLDKKENLLYAGVSPFGGFTDAQASELTDLKTEREALKKRGGDLQPTAKQQFMLDVGNDIANKTMGYLDVYVKDNPTTRFVDATLEKIFYPAALAKETIQKFFPKDSPVAAEIFGTAAELGVLHGMAKGAKAVYGGGKAALDEVGKIGEGSVRAGFSKISQEVKKSVQATIDKMYGREKLTESDFDIFEKQLKIIEQEWRETKTRTSKTFTTPEDQQMFKEYFAEKRAKLKALREAALKENIIQKEVSGKRVYDVRDQLRSFETAAKEKAPSVVPVLPKAPQGIPDFLKEEYARNIAEAQASVPKVETVPEAVNATNMPSQIENVPESYNRSSVPERTVVDSPRPDVLEMQKLEQSTSLPEIPKTDNKIVERSTNNISPSTPAPDNTLYMPLEDARKLTTKANTRTQILVDAVGKAHQYAFMNGKWVKTRNNNISTSSVPKEGYVPVDFFGKAPQKAGGVWHTEAKLGKSSSFQNENNLVKDAQGLRHPDVGETVVKMEVKGDKVKSKKQKNIDPRYVKDYEQLQGAKSVNDYPPNIRRILEKDMDVVGALFENLMEVPAIADLYAELVMRAKGESVTVKELSTRIKEVVETELAAHLRYSSKALDAVLDSLSLDAGIKKLIKDDYLSFKTPNIKNRGQKALYDEAFDKVQKALEDVEGFSETYGRYIDLDSFMEGGDFTQNVSVMAARNVMTRHGSTETHQNLQKYFMDKIENNPEALKLFEESERIFEDVEVSEKSTPVERSTVSMESTNADVMDTLKALQQKQKVEAPYYWKGTTDEWVFFVKNVAEADKAAFFTLIQEKGYKNFVDSEALNIIELTESRLGDPAPREQLDVMYKRLMEADKIAEDLARIQADKKYTAIEQNLPYKRTVNAFREGFKRALKEQMSAKELLQTLAEMSKDLKSGTTTLHSGLGHWQVAKKLVEEAGRLGISLATHIKNSFTDIEGKPFSEREAKRYAEDFIETLETWENIKAPEYSFGIPGEKVNKISEMEVKAWASAQKVKSELNLKKKEIKNARVNKLPTQKALTLEYKALIKQFKKFPKKLRTGQHPHAFYDSEVRGALGINPNYKPGIGKDLLTPKVFQYEGLLGDFGNRIWHGFMKAQQSEGAFAMLITKHLVREARKMRLSKDSLKRTGDYMMAQQPGGPEALIKANRKVITAAELTESEKMYATTVRNWFDSLLEDAQNAHYVFTGKQLVKRENYYTVLGNIADLYTQDRSVWSQTPDAIERMRRDMKKAPVPGIAKTATTIARVGETEVLKVVDRYANALAHYKYSTPIIDRALALINKEWDLMQLEYPEAKVLRDEMLARGVKPDKKGRLMWKMSVQRPEAFTLLHETIVQAYSRKLKGYDPENFYHKVLYNLANDVAASTLSLSFSSMLNQLGSLPDILAGTSLSALSRGLVRAVANDRAYKVSSTFEKYSNSFDEACYSFMLQRNYGSFKQQVLTTTLIPMQLFDGFVRKVAWEAGYIKATETLKLPEREAIRYADTFVVKSQSNSNFVNRPKLQADFVGKILTPLQSFSINQYSYITRELMGMRGYEKINEYKNGMFVTEKVNALPSKKIARNLVSGILANAAMGLIYNQVLDMHAPNADPINAFIHGLNRTQEYDEATYDALVEVIGLYPLLGNLRYIKGNRKQYIFGAGIGTGIDALAGCVSVPTKYRKYRAKGMPASEAFGKVMEGRDMSAIWKALGAPLGKQLPATIRNWDNKLNAITGQSFEKQEAFKKGRQTDLQWLKNEKPTPAPSKRRSRKKLIY